MDSQRVETSPSLSGSNRSFLRSSDDGNDIDGEGEFSLRLSTYSQVFLGIAIALATVGIPLSTVLLERPIGQKYQSPHRLKGDEFKPSSTLPGLRIGELDS